MRSVGFSKHIHLVVPTNREHLPSVLDGSPPLVLSFVQRSAFELGLFKLASRFASGELEPSVVVSLEPESRADSSIITARTLKFQMRAGWKAPMSSLPRLQWPGPPRNGAIDDLEFVRAVVTAADMLETQLSFVHEGRPTRLVLLQSLARVLCQTGSRSRLRGDLANATVADFLRQDFQFHGSRTPGADLLKGWANGTVMRCAERLW